MKPQPPVTRSAIIPSPRLSPAAHGLRAGCDSEGDPVFPTSNDTPAPPTGQGERPAPRYSSTSQTMTCPLSPPAAASIPSGLTATERTLPTGQANDFTSAAVVG